ncbi:hypothetical protein NUW58_g5181 [Xylaria curta]|uniref:Uncharacterized protein n=2 Tax=Xylaria curta TaxID=42375 RepID=A0ACC1NNH4_9PEZI|nr:hypothetical protein NUW58_g7027 [Xylaria curta]KAJ2986118.1 hypothetical protein NUW58_g5181 [Xylaria curta]
MKLLTLVALCSALGSVSAAPASDECLAKKWSKLTSCEEIRTDQDGRKIAFLQATCHGFHPEQKKWKKKSAGLDLNKCVMNVDGHLQPKQDGNLADNCTEMLVEKNDKEVVLSATCSGPLNNELDTVLSLGSFITVDNGDLTCFGFKGKDDPSYWEKD